MVRWFHLKHNIKAAFITAQESGNRECDANPKQELITLEKLRNRFHQLPPAPHNPITGTLDHRIHYGPFTHPCSPQISSDPDDFLFE
jgi:hypothetical protein